MSGCSIFIRTVSLVLFGLSVTPALAQEPPGRPEEDGHAIITFALENDLFTGSDDGYTNGARLGYITSEAGLANPTKQMLRLLPFFPQDGHGRFGFSLGQNMYTPRNQRAGVLQTNDRPYAGWLYASAAAIVENGRRLDTLEWTVGVVGPASLAEHTQDFVHSVKGVSKANGWDNQLKNEPGLMVSYQRKWKGFYSVSPMGVGFDVTPQAGFSLGNVFTNASTGVMFRLGFDLPDDYGPPLIQPSLSGSDFFIPTDTLGGYLFAAVDGQAVARNIFLDGNTWSNSHSMDKKYFVGGFQAGVAVTYRNTRVACTYSLRSKEFDGQDYSSDYGAITLSYRF